MPESESTKHRFFVAGMEILAEDGLGGLKLAALCRRVGVTSGSFYHFFDSWQDFARQLVESWRDEHTVQAAEIARAEVDPAERVELLLRFGVSLPHAAEAAIRAWSGESTPSSRRSRKASTASVWTPPPRHSRR